MPNIIYTLTDEAPALATRSLLPIIQTFVRPAGVRVETSDISLASRILANFSDKLSEQQRVPDALSQLSELAKTPEANIIKLPNVSASVPQLKTAIAELQSKGYPVPDYPDKPQTPEQQAIKQRYSKVLGSAVNPVLREGNSDRRAPNAVKAFAKKNPHSMGPWSSSSRTHVATMQHGDFRANEKSTTVDADGSLRIELVNKQGDITILRDEVSVLAGDIIDATVMNVTALKEFLRAEIADAKAQGVLFSVHLKATMMKVSDPIIFGHAVTAFFDRLFQKHGSTLTALGVNVNNGLGNLLATIEQLPAEKRAEIESDIQFAYDHGPDLAMVDSQKGITNLHVPSDVIVDASMPAMIRTSGKMWNKEGMPQDTKAVIPDSSYAEIYQATIDSCKKHGAFDPATMGTVPNVGLMAQKAEEYGSHDTTFEIAEAGNVRIIDSTGVTLLEHTVQPGDIWRMCQVKDAPVRDWVRLAVTRATVMNCPAIFWLDQTRPHDAQLIKKATQYLAEQDTEGLQFDIMSPGDAMRFTLDRVRAGKDTISVTGNILRDYLTDLFPILELGTSAKMLSIVPLMKGGGLFETGAGGSAPKHVQQFLAENHLRWDSLGEFLALAVSLEHLAETTGNTHAKVLANALDKATGKVLEMGKSPSRNVNELDNRGSHFYLALYWAQALAKQSTDQVLREYFAPLALQLAENEANIVEELNAVQGTPQDIGGYFFPDEAKACSAMRPSPTLNKLLGETV